MQQIQIGLILGYVFLAALVLMAVIHGRLRWWLKLALVVLAGGFYLLSYQGWKQSQGWPSLTGVPDRFLFHFAVIEEPDDSGNDGAIFIWLTDLYGDELAAEPRAYRLPYDQQTHARVESAMRRSKAGNLQIGLRKGGEDLPEVKKFRNQLGDKVLELEFVPVPDPALPEK